MFQQLEKNKPSGNMNFSTLLKTFLILQLSISVKGSCLDDYIGDEFCDDENNNDGCDYDGGKTFVNLVRWTNFQKKSATALFQF